MVGVFSFGAKVLISAWNSKFHLYELNEVEDELPFALAVANQAGPVVLILITCLYEIPITENCTYPGDYYGKHWL
jgi:hypothetical protein